MTQTANIKPLSSTSLLEYHPYIHLIPHSDIDISNVVKNVDVFRDASRVVDAYKSLNFIGDSILESYHYSVLVYGSHRSGKSTVAKYIASQLNLDIVQYDFQDLYDINPEQAWYKLKEIVDRICNEFCMLILDRQYIDGTCDSSNPSCKFRSQLNSILSRLSSRVLVVFVSNDRNITVRTDEIADSCLFCAPISAVEVAYILSKYLEFVSTKLKASKPDSASFNVSETVETIRNSIKAMLPIGEYIDAANRFLMNQNLNK